MSALFFFLLGNVWDLLLSPSCFIQWGETDVLAATRTMAKGYQLCRFSFSCRQKLFFREGGLSAGVTSEDPEVMHFGKACFHFSHKGTI